MRNAGLDKAQAGIKIIGRNINNLRYADDINLMAESKEELKSILMRVKEESENAGLKLNIQKTKIWSHHFMANRGGKVETMTGFIFLGSKITMDCDCSHVIKKMLSPWQKSYSKPRQHTKKQRHHFANNIHIVKAIVFPLGMLGM